MKDMIFNNNSGKKWVLSLLAGFSSIAQAIEPAKIDASVHDFVDKFCIRCHNAKKTKGHLRLDKLSYSIENPSQAQAWQDILDVLNLGEMPPEDAKQPDKDTMTDILENLTHKIVDARHHMAHTRSRESCSQSSSAYSAGMADVGRVHGGRIPPQGFRAEP